MKQFRFKWAFIIVTMVMICAQIASGSEPCSFDLDNDGDVDGLDLSLFYQLPDTSPQDSSDFAGQFGKTDCLVVPAPLITFAANPEMTNGLTPATLSWNVLYADSITIDPGLGDVSAITYIDVTPDVTTEYTLTATGKGGSSNQKITVSVDTQPPSMISFYPLNNSVVAANGADITLLGTFGDNLAGIKSVVLRDHENADITSSALVTGSTIEYVISPTQEKTYVFSVTLEDQVGNILNYPVSFRVDNTLPVIASNMDSGRYFSPLSINLAASEDAVIYYSTDGYPPFVGAANTQSGDSQVLEIPISKTTRLQFFSVDTAGNREETRAIDFMLNDIIAPVTGLNAIYNQPLNQVLLSWIQQTDAQIYNIYRCMNMADRVILKDSLENGYPPPKRLKIGSTTGNISNYTNLADLVEGGTYYYGVTFIDPDGVESVICDLVEADITAQNPSLTKEEAAVRATAWLQNNQHPNGAWDTGGKQILSTSQALNGLRLANVQNAGMNYGLFYLRGSKADNTDYLSRKILTLFNHGQNVDEAVNRLISKSYIRNAQIYGWGLNHSFMVDALDSALGTKALGCLSIDLKDADGTPLADLGKRVLEVWGPVQGPENTKYGWVPGKDISAFVSAAVYSVTLPKASISGWLTNLQQANGSFENNITDTAGMLIWQSDIIQDKAAARQYLVSTQLMNGSWENDLYLTGLCLEALLK
jgi:hypothetical protein